MTTTMEPTTVVLNLAGPCRLEPVTGGKSAGALLSPSSAPKRPWKRRHVHHSWPWLLYSASSVLLPVLASLFTTQVEGLEPVVTMLSFHARFVAGAEYTWNMAESMLMAKRRPAGCSMPALM